VSKLAMMGTTATPTAVLPIVIQLVVAMVTFVPAWKPVTMATQVMAMRASPTAMLRVAVMVMCVLGSKRATTETTAMPMHA